jgi:hypothetical protein
MCDTACVAIRKPHLTRREPHLTSPSERGGTGNQTPPPALRGSWRGFGLAHLPAMKRAL